MATKVDFAVSGQHYLFNVPSFAQTILALGGDSYCYALRDRSTRGVMEDVVEGRAELGVIVEVSSTREALEADLAAAGLEFHELATSAPRVALPVTHPFINAKSLAIEQLADYPYVFFDQGPDSPVQFYEEALAEVPRAKRVITTDRATLSELIMALNGYTVTSGIFVGITDGTALTTIPLQTDVVLHLGYITKQGTALSAVGERFVDHLKKSLDFYVD